MSGLKNFPKTINGDTVVGFTNSGSIKDLGWHDSATLSSWYRDDPEKNHLGMIELFSSMAEYRMPTYKNFFENMAVLNVNGANGKFTYDVPVTKEGGCYTNRDSSESSEVHGIDGSTFEIGLDAPFSNGDILTYDAMHGENLIVSADHEVRQEGDSWIHVVKLVSNNRKAWYPKDKLKKGIQYFKIAHGMGEFSTKFSQISAPKTDVSTLKCEFTLGNHRGVETFMTMYAAEKKFSGATVHTNQFWDFFVEEQEKLGFDSMGRKNDVFFVAKKNANGKLSKKGLKVGSALEYLVLLELMKMESHQLLFQRGGMITDDMGTVRLNEGIWHQIRRGRIITYSRKGNITRSHIREAAQYLFKANTSLLPHERKMKFKCGYMAYLNMLEIFREEFKIQIQNLSLLLGTDRVLPKSPVSGSLQALELEPVIITKVPIPDIGIVEIEHDPSLDYQPLTERFSRGFHGDGYAETTWSMVIWDAASDEYSNAYSSLPSGTKVAAGGSEKANIYYVKPEDSSMWWGYENGRWAGDKASDIASSMKHMGREFWAHSISAAWVRDISKYLVIELKR